jgi:glutathione peroxidase
MTAPPSHPRARRGRGWRVRRTVVIAAVMSGLTTSAVGAGAGPVIPASHRGPVVLAGAYTGLDGSRVNLNRMRGRVVLVVNTASNCGFTTQFRPLEALWRTKRAKGLTIIGVPSGDFQQELPTDRLVQRFCTRNFGVSFPMLRISTVTGPKAIPLFKGLASPAWSREPQWNFNKYLVDRTGRVAMYFPSSVEPDSAGMTNAIDTLLAERGRRATPQ